MCARTYKCDSGPVLPGSPKASLGLSLPPAPVYTQALANQCSPPFPRRAHLKECFETLKRNIPNVDDKKTSNLSVLRTALRYIQVWGREAGLGGAWTATAPASSCYRQVPPPVSTRVLSTWPS